jgi:RNA polymerase primary sigma factor
MKYKDFYVSEIGVEKFDESHETSNDTGDEKRESTLDVRESIPEHEQEDMKVLSNKGGNGTPDEQHRILNDYFRDIAREPLLTLREEVEIPAKIKRCECKARDIRAVLEKLHSKSIADQRQRILSKNRLKASLRAYSHKAESFKKRFASANLRLVISIAKRYMNHGLPFLDLIQEGNIGLMKAIDKYDYTKGYRFSTYASWWIYQSITRAILVHRGAVRVPVYLLEVTNRVYRTRALMLKELGRNPTPEELAEQSGVPIKYVKRIMKITNDALSLDSPVDGESRTLYDFIEDDESISPDYTVVHDEMRQSVRNSLSLLSAKEEEVLRLRFGIDRNETVTLDDIGRKFKLTRERIRQIEKKALRKLSVCKMKEALKQFR